MTESNMPAASPLKKTALNAAHRALKAKMVDFGGWDMPVEYPGYTPQRHGPVAGDPGDAPATPETENVAASAQESAATPAAETA